MNRDIRIIILTMVLFLAIGAFILIGCSKKIEPIEGLILETCNDISEVYVKVAWEPVEGAAGYYVAVQPVSGGIEHFALTPEVEMVFSDLIYGETYIVTVQSYIFDWRKRRVLSDPVRGEISTFPVAINKSIRVPFKKSIREVFCMSVDGKLVEMATWQ